MAGTVDGGTDSAPAAGPPTSRRSGSTRTDRLSQATAAASRGLSPDQLEQYRWHPAVKPADDKRAVLAVVAVLVIVLSIGAGVTTRRSWLAMNPPPTTAPVVMRPCWDGSSAAENLPCPALAGEAALRWVFVTTEPFDSCTPYTAPGGVGSGEVESYDCAWRGVNADVFISRWNSHAEALEYYSYYFGTGSPVDIGGSPTARSWCSTEPTGGGDPGCALLYNDYPLSVLTLGADAAAALSRIDPRPPRDLEQQR